MTSPSEAQSTDEQDIPTQLAAFEKASAYAVFPFEFEGKNGSFHYHGIGKRELFAAMAMSGWFAGCANAYNEFTGNDRPPVQMAKACVQAADALLAALQEVKP